MLQQNYTNETVQRCRQQPTDVNGRKIPTRFQEQPQNVAESCHHSAEVDIRIIEQETIDMSNKFYALTAPMIHSILTNDLNAEFPLDLSQDEHRIIHHYQTSSLILGRSGTGKTTCLVFKLIGKYLTRTRLAGGEPIKQVRTSLP